MILTLKKIENLTVIKIKVLSEMTLCRSSLCLEGTQCLYVQWSDCYKRMTALPLKLKASGSSDPRSIPV